MKFTRRVGPEVTLVLCALAAMPLAAQAQPPARAETDPEPAVRPPRLHQAPRPPRPEKLVANFEELFGRKLTDDQLAQIKAATDARDAAVRAAQQAWYKQFFAIAGVTEEEVRQKQRELRQKQAAEAAARHDAPVDPATRPPAGTAPAPAAPPISTGTPQTAPATH